MLNTNDMVVHINWQPVFIVFRDWRQNIGRFITWAVHLQFFLLNCEIFASTMFHPVFKTTNRTFTLVPSVGTHYVCMQNMIYMNVK